MFRTLAGALAVALCIAPVVRAGGGKYTIQVASAPVPREVAPAIASLLDAHAVRLLNSEGAVIADVWLCKQVPVKAVPAGATVGYRDLEETTVLGAVRFDKPVTDYRKQKIKPGVYTLRLGFQPMDGDHMGTAPFPEFALVVPAALDTKPDTMDPKKLQDMSAKATGGSHPGVFLLYPDENPPAAPKLVAKEADTWVLNAREPVAGGSKAVLGVGLTLVGHTAS